MGDYGKLARTATRVACALGVLAVVRVTPAFAQLTPVNVGPEPELGIHMGGFLLYPTLDVSGEYNDNVFAVNTGAQSDFSYHVRPEVDLESTWTHYLVSLKAEYDLHRYDVFSQENTNDYFVSGETKFDLGSDSQLDAMSQYAQLSELPGNTNVTTNAATPVTYLEWDNKADFKHVFNRLQVDLGGTYTTLRFSNVAAVGGGTLLEIDRNRDVTSGYADLGFQFSPGYQLFARGTWNERDYELASSDFRNSTGYEAVAGVRTQITHLIDGQAYVGYLSQDYSGFSQVSGLDYGLQLNWSVTPLTTIVADVTRSIEETDEAGASSYFATIASLGVTHSLTRTITLNANFSYQKNDYQGIVRNEDIYGATVGADYELTPHFHLAADYKYTTRESDIAGTSYDQNLVEARVRLAL